MSRVTIWLQKLSTFSLVIVCALCMSLVALVNYFSSPEISTSIFYLLPIAVAAWFINRDAGMAFSITAAVLWFAVDYSTNSGIPFSVIFWNATVRLGFFLIVVFSLVALHRSLRRQEDLMYFIVHDLRAPLGNMLAAFDLLQMDIAIAGESRAELVKLGLSSGNRMVVLIDSLLDLSRLESGALQLQQEDLKLEELIEESIAQAALSADFKSVSFVRQYYSGETTVFADRLLTQRIMANLLNNAIKFSPEGGIITLQTLLGPERNVMVSVHDQGPGIPVEWQQRVFNKHGQVANSTGGGTGLGLAFCKFAVEAQDGRIWLESEEGSGTVFRFTLPSSSH